MFIEEYARNGDELINHILALITSGICGSCLPVRGDVDVLSVFSESCLTVVQCHISLWQRQSIFEAVLFPFRYLGVY